MKTVVEMLIECDNRRRQGNWVPACGGTETPFYTRSGKRLLYVYQPTTGDHAYLDCESDLILTDEESRTHLGTF